MRNLHCRLALVCIVILCPGCKQQAPEPPIWEQVKIGDLAQKPPSDQGAPALNALNLEVHQYNIPAENIKQLEALWEPLRLRGLRYQNREAFRANGFRAARGRITVWDMLVSTLAQVKARKARTVSFLLSPGHDSDLPLLNLGRGQDVAFSDIEGNAQNILIGPGTITWRLRIEEDSVNPALPKLTAYPVFQRAGIKSMRYHTGLKDSRQIAFLSAGFSVRMGYGDLIALGPDGPVDDASSLKGLFFGIPQALFLGLNRTEPVKTCPAVRVFVLTCSGMK